MKRLLYILGTCILLFRCGGYPTGYDPTPQPNVEQMVIDGWSYFTMDSLNNANNLFNEALKNDSANVGAHVGKGWSLLLMQQGDKDSSGFHLQKGIADSLWKLDAHCGLAVVNFIRTQYASVLSPVNTVLSESPTYVFGYKQSVDWKDLIIIKAQVQYFEKDYWNAWQTLDNLSHEFDLDPDASETWVVQSVTYYSFEAALSKVLAILSERYAD